MQSLKEKMGLISKVAEELDLTESVLSLGHLQEKVSCHTTRYFLIWLKVKEEFLSGMYQRFCFRIFELFIL